MFAVLADMDTEVTAVAVQPSESAVNQAAQSAVLVLEASEQPASAAASIVLDCNRLSTAS